MKHRVLLVYLPGHVIGYGPIFPLGIGYLLSYLKEDRPTKAVHFEVMEQALMQLPGIIDSFRPDIVGITCSTFNRGNVRSVCKWIKNEYPEIRIVLGGVHVSFFPGQAIFNYGADYVVVGEGEVTLKELCDTLDMGWKAGEYLSEVKGICYKSETGMVITEPREPIADINDLPIPDFSYAKNMIRNSGLGFVFTSRGCPSRCNFCSTGSYWGQKVRTVSVSRIVDEMENMVENYGSKKILFHDDTFNLGIDRTISICNEIMKRKVNVTWAASCRVHPVSENMIDTMVEAGCRHICWGVESGSPSMLSRINKKITQEQIRIAYALCRKHIGKISVGAFAMVGNPGESEQTITESVNFFNTLPLTDSPGAAVLYILPGTPIYEDLRKKDPNIDNFWVESDSIMHPREYSGALLQQWARRVSNSGLRIPFDRNNHFFNGILFGNIPKPVTEDV